MSKKSTKSSKSPRKFWKVEITPQFREFERLAERHGMSTAAFLRAIPRLFSDHVFPRERRLWMVRSLRNLEYISECVSIGTSSEELLPLLNEAVIDIRDGLANHKGEAKK